MPVDLLQYRAFTFRAGGSAVPRATPETVWGVVSEIGGDNRYFAMNALWTIREWMDAAVGGSGMEHRRPARRELHAGDRIDSWEVLIAEPAHRLALVFGMKAPGEGVLEFVVAGMGGGTRLTATAYWEPDGVAGVLYWRAMQPAHILLFRRLTAEICHRAEARQAGDKGRRSGRATAGARS